MKLRRCRHCGRPKANRARGMCYACYADPAIRTMHAPSDHPCQRRGAGTTAVRLPEPTDALPGSAEKVVVLEDRAANDLALWHPRDAMGDVG